MPAWQFGCLAQPQCQWRYTPHLLTRHPTPHAPLPPSDSPLTPAAPPPPPQQMTPYLAKSFGTTESDRWMSPDGSVWSLNRSTGVAMSSLCFSRGTPPRK